MLRKSLCFGLILVLSLALAPAAMALRALGPVNPLNGYPTYVQDEFGVQLDLPVPPYGDGVTAPTMIFDPVIPGNTLSAAAGFGTEAFFFLATSNMTLPNGGKAILVLGVEAAYGSGVPDPASPPDQFLFSRVRVRFDATVAGTYTVTHPWGVETMEVTAADLGARFSHVFDWGGFAPSPSTVPVIPSSFERILISPKPWRFLTPATKVAATGEESWILGDGVTLTTVTGGFNGVNDFTIVGPANAFGTGVNTVATTLFTVSGHIAGAAIPFIAPTPPPVVDTITITLARYNTKNQNLEVRATSTNPAAVLTAVGYGVLVNGRLTAHASPAPASVTVTSSFGGSSTALVQIK